MRVVRNKTSIIPSTNGATDTSVGSHIFYIRKLEGCHVLHTYR